MSTRRQDHHPWCEGCAHLHHGTRQTKGYVACELDRLYIDVDTRPWLDDRPRTMPRRRGGPWIRVDAALMDQQCSGHTSSTGSPTHTPSTSTGLPEWSEHTATKRWHRQRERINQQAAEMPPFVCPYCGKVSPALTLAGKPRQVCSAAQCRGKAWAARAHLAADVRRGLAADLISEILTLRDRGRSYGEIGRLLGLPRSTVSGVVARHRRKEKA